MLQRFQPTLLNSPGAETEGAGLNTCTCTRVVIQAVYCSCTSIMLL